MFSNGFPQIALQQTLQNSKCWSYKKLPVEINVGSLKLRSRFVSILLLFVKNLNLESGA